MSPQEGLLESGKSGCGPLGRHDQPKRAVAGQPHHDLTVGREVSGGRRDQKPSAGREDPPGLGQSPPEVDLVYKCSQSHVKTHTLIR